MESSSIYEISCKQQYKSKKGQKDKNRIFGVILSLQLLSHISLQIAADAETDDNVSEQKRMKNKTLRYGEIIQVTANSLKK